MMNNKPYDLHTFCHIRGYINNVLSEAIGEEETTPEKMRGVTLLFWFNSFVIIKFRSEVIDVFKTLS
jgi:hypothetical protein